MPLQVLKRQPLPLADGGRRVVYSFGDGDPIRPMPALKRMAVEHALRRTGGNCALAARRLGIGRATIYRLMERYGIGPYGMRG